MTTHDLSLLTDELTDDERKILEGVRQQGVRVVKRNEIEPLFNALIAARAENKRKDEVLRDVDAHLDGLSQLGIREWLGETAYKDAHATIHMRIRAALLQSEKGKCRVKKKLIAKLEELLRQGYETVTIHQVLEWIHAFSPLPRGRR